MLKNARLVPWLIFGLSFLCMALFSVCRLMVFLYFDEKLWEPDWLLWGCDILSWIIIFSACALTVRTPQKIYFSFSCLLFSGLCALIIKFYSDLGLLFFLMKDGHLGLSFSGQLALYIEQDGLFMLINSGCLVIALLMRSFQPFEITTPEKTRRSLGFSGAFYVIVLPLMLSLLLPILNTVLLWIVPTLTWEPLSYKLMSVLNSVAVLLIIGFIAWAYSVRILLNIERFAWLKWFQMASCSLGIILIVNVMALLWTMMRWHQISTAMASVGFQFILNHYQIIFPPLLPVMMAFVIVSLLTFRLKKKLFDETDKACETSGYFGSAVFAKQKEYQSLNLYKSDGQIPIGMDERKQLLFAPLEQKMTLAPKGTGKSACSSIPVLLTYNGPIFALDVKGELWATTARYRHEVMGRNVVVIDPFGITKGADFIKGKPDALLKEYHFNPFDWLPEEGEWRDRILNTFAASFIVDERGPIKHFDENAKILIRGYIDYMMTYPKETRNLSKLYELMSESPDDATQTFEQMALCGGRAAAAANQIMRVGSDERGSILSTAYRQIDWIGDRNLGKLLSSSNFDLKDFLKGNMDIFIVLPPDQVKEHNRLVRMLIALLLGLLVQTSPSDLPNEKILILLDEIAQLGYCPDVEECIEVLRAWGVVVWSVFQTLSQVELFEKPDLLKGSTIKQIFTNDDTKTMEWIQTLGAKKTVVTKTVSTNKGQSKQTNQMFAGNKSSGEGESVQETGVDLLPLNEIREMPFDEQLIFMAGMKPIRCKKAWYFEHPYFAGRFDDNPLETKRTA